MKKFLVIVILFIPIILVLALNSAAKVVSFYTPANPDQIEIRNSRNVVVNEDETIEVDILTKNDFVIINILPQIVKNQKINEPVVNGEFEGEIKLENIEGTNRYKIIPIKAGYVQLIISPQDNINVKRILSFNVVSETLTDLKILDAERNVLNTSNAMGEKPVLTSSYKLTYDAKPFSALNYASIIWDWVPKEAIKISINGEIEVLDREVLDKNEGIVEVILHVKGKDKDSKRASTYLDFSNALVKKTQVYTSEAVDVNWIKNNVVFEENAKVVKLSDSVFEVSLDDRKINVNVAKKDAKYYFSDGITVVYTNNMVQKLLVSNAENDTELNQQNVSFKSSDNSILTIDEQGYILARKAGKVTVSAKVNDVLIGKEIIVRELNPEFQLSLTHSDQFRGIRQDRVWAVNFYEEKITNSKNEQLGWEERLNSITITNQFEMSIEKDLGRFDVVWVSDDPALTVNTKAKGQQNVNKDLDYLETIAGKNDAVLTVSEAAAGKTITLSAYMAVTGKYIVEDMCRTFKFKFFEDENAVNVTSHLQCVKAYEERKDNMILQDDILINTSEYDDRLPVFSNIWGNGFEFSRTLTDTQYNYAGILDVRKGWENHEPSEEYTSFIADDFILSTVPSLTEKKYEEYVRVGLNLRCENIPAHLRYLQIKNCRTGIEIRRSIDTTLEGCIIGDNKVIGVLYYSEWSEQLNNHKFTLKNTVFSISDGPSIMFFCDNLDNVGTYYGKNILPNVSFESNVRFYNWKSREQLENFIEVFLSVFGDDPIIKGLASWLRPFWLGVMNDKDWDNLFMKYKGKEYASMVMFIYGFAANNDLSKLNLSEQYQTQVLPLENEDTKGTVTLIKTILFSIMQVSQDHMYDNHLVGYNFAKGVPEIMPFEPIPASNELYESLRTEGLGYNVKLAK